MKLLPKKIGKKAVEGKNYLSPYTVKEKDKISSDAPITVIREVRLIQRE